MARNRLIKDSDNPLKTGPTDIDLQERVIERDRARAGRKPPETTAGDETTNETSKLHSEFPTSETANIQSNVTTNESIKETSLEDWLEAVLEASRVPVVDGTTARLNIEIDQEQHFAL